MTAARSVLLRDEYRRARRRRTLRTWILPAVAHAGLMIGSAVMLIPFAWMLSTALKGEGSIFIYPPQWIPRPPEWVNFATIFRVEPFARYLLNSLIYAVFASLGQVVTCTMAGFAFARLRFRGRETIFMLQLATLMVPGQVTIIPTFVLMKYLGWLNTLKPLIVPNWTGGAFGAFMLRQFFLTVPRELADAARIDGCSWYGILTRIFAPLAKPALTTLALFNFMWAWNDLFGPLIYLNSSQKYTVSLGLAFFQAVHFTYWNWMMAASVVAVVPIIVLFAFGQRYFVQGIATTGLKA
jgi:ABC-type glycerol-3-phosphate transport system permease component